MYFKKLEIFGFKSFADKTVLNFREGITAVIGPNGCGKSNVFDAIRWVLGEQSIKELRGSSMEDVIFNGTDKKSGLGFAEVSLTFSNDSRMLPVDYDEVTVTRRLFRSGESEYLLNKTQVRLKDIVELFLGTGIGAEAYSLVQQGKVDLVVSAKPEERRVILDEASGVTKYKAKRKEALSKLKDTENNLLRINDIVVEVKRQISSLERQAKKARRYKDKFEELKQMEVQLAHHELNRLADKHQQSQALLEELKTEEKALGAALGDLNQGMTQKNDLLEDLEGKISEVNTEEIKLAGQLDIHNRQIDFNKERIESIAANEKRIEESKGQVLERCRTHSDKIEEVKLSLSMLEETLQKNLGDLDNKKNSLKEIAIAVKEANTAIEYEENEMMAITSNQVNVNNKLTETMKETQVALARKNRLQIEHAKVMSEKETTDQKFNSLVTRIESAQGRMSDLQEALAGHQTTLKEKTTQLSSLEGDIDGLEKTKLSLQSQKEFIEKLCVQYDDIPDPVVEGRLFTNTSPMDHHTGIVGKVKEVLPAGPQEYKIICETKFIELDPQQISNRIEQLSGEIVDKTMRKNELLAGVEEQRRLIGQIEFKIQEEEKILSIFGMQKKGIVGESNKLLEELEVLSLEARETEEALVILKTNEKDLKRQIERLGQDIELSEDKIQEKRDWIVLRSREREETIVAIAQVETEVAAFEGKKKDYSDNISMFTEAMNNSLEEMKRLENEYTELEEKREKFLQDIQECHQKIGEAKGQKASLQSVGAGYAKHKDEVDQKINTIEAEITDHTQKIDEIKNKIHGHQLSDQQTAFKEKEIRDRLLQSYKIDLDALEEEAPAGTSEESEAAQEEQYNFEELPGMIEQIRKKCDSFGTVNLVAIEEFDELRERFEFLTKQQSDLITAKESLHQTIRKINSQTRKMFMDTFTRVSEEFRVYYRMLFGGGDAQLVLLDPDNVLESGIEIIARPPGKKLQNINLLSGGEKSLTAIALIFGVFRVNPSPFCVLDEIDAALDESNVGRFNYLLKDFAKIAQFIIITHNKKTIASADVLYGITMEETGISKLVSVKFKDDQPKDPQPDKQVIGV